MLDAKQAANIARDYIYTFIDREIYHVFVEEIVPSDDGKYWFITLGFSLVASSPFHERQYKVFKVDKEDGTVLAMKMRGLEEMPF
jgi:hypothetical protein